MATFSMNQMTTLRWSFEQDCFRYREAGLSAIHVWRDKIHDFGEAKGATLLEELGLSVSAVSWAGGFTGSDGRNFKDAMVDARHAVDLAHELEAGCLIVYSGARGDHIVKHASRLFSAALDELIPYAEDRGVTLAIKPIRHKYGADWTLIRRMTDALQLIDLIDSPRFKLVLDLYEFGDQTDVLENLHLLIPYLALVQVGDRGSEPQEEPNRCLLGDGHLALEATIARLIQLGFEGPFDIELMGRDVQQLEYEQMLNHSVGFLQAMNSTP
ncbi:sugar phosphate isomerase/epimerase family protein [Blastopirellula marina]|uniref:Sugar phosphate isomerase/epimerase n=1 Tax=Blastopirellula marina TaxID=124 RepID=A0A2S8GUK0_9BACT|nr:sugar phosphate isomerase/epimerase family protein [Blastopirellula marina]PQO48115.1 sugar phosphate isomerase/epimerase [Blastopirellula marina]